MLKPPANRPDPYADKDEQPSVPVPLTAQQAKQLAQQHPAISPWWVVLGQLAVGLVVSLAFWGISGRVAVAVSAAYGALVVVVPAALFARGLGSRFASTHVGAAVMGFFVWEFIKIAVSVAMLFAAQRWVPNLSWPAMLLSMVLTMKVYWLALRVKRKPRAGQGSNV